MIKIIEIKSIIGKEIRRNSIIFQIEYSKIFLLEIRDRKNRNIRNTRKGRKIKIPILDTMGLG